MKSCLTMFFIVAVFATVLLGCGFLYYISRTTEFSKTSQTPPRAVPVPRR